MADRTCPKCLTKYRYPSILKQHFENTYHCKQTPEYITNYFIINKNKNVNVNENVIENVNKCLKCKKCFVNSKALNRHYKETICGKLQKISTKINLNPTLIKSLTSEQLSKISEIIIKNEKQIVSNTANITNTINNNHITNNTINNNTIIQHINPFGFEDIRTIPIDEMKKILNSGTDAGFQIIKAIYNKIENKNFYKPNISRSEVACLNNEFNLTIYKSREFCDALFDRCISLLHHMLYLCKDEFTKNNIKCIYSNIEHIENTMRIEIYEKKLQNVVETEFRNNNMDTKDRIKNFIKKIKEEADVKDNSLLMIKNSIDLKDEKNEEYKTSIKNEELNKLFGDPKVILGLKKQEIILNLRISRFEESYFYNFWKDRLQNIKDYIMNHKESTIGDVINISKEENKINAMLDLIRLRVEHARGQDYIDLNINDEFKINDFKKIDF